MKKTTKEKLTQINSFWSENKDLEQIICDELKSRKNKSPIKCMSFGVLNDMWGDKNINNCVYLAIGLKRNDSINWHNNEKESLYAVGFNKWEYKFNEEKKEYEETFNRIVTPFCDLPVFTQIAIFQTAFCKFEYPYNSHNKYKDFLKRYCSKDLNKLPPCFNECFFADEKNNLHKITFSGNYEKNGCYIFNITSKSGKLKGKKIILHEDDMMTITKGSVSQWGFDYALSLDKEQLRKTCIGGFLKDYTI